MNLAFNYIHPIRIRIMLNKIIVTHDTAVETAHKALIVRVRTTIQFLKYYLINIFKDNIRFGRWIRSCSVYDGIDFGLCLALHGRKIFVNIYMMHINTHLHINMHQYHTFFSYNRNMYFWFQFFIEIKTKNKNEKWWSKIERKITDKNLIEIVCLYVEFFFLERK